VILETLVLGPMAVNCYLVGDGSSDEGIIIDPGDEPDVIEKAIQKNKLNIKYIVVTHGHIDHIGALREIKGSTGAEVCIYKSGEASLSRERVNAMSAMFGLSYAVPLPPDRLLEEGARLDVGKLSFLVLHTPGHSPDSICLAGAGVVFSGDTLFSGSIGRYDFPGGSFTELMHSIKTKLMVLPDSTVVHPGHGPSSTIGEERCDNPYLNGLAF
jgi:hydroxyacylglutathione hydrolase